MAEVASNSSVKPSSSADTTLVVSPVSPAASNIVSGSVDSTKLESTRSPSASTSAAAQSAASISVDLVESKPRASPLFHFSSPRFLGSMSPHDLDLAFLPFFHFFAVSGAELVDALSAQIEFTFSREHLSGDYSIVSQMNGDLFVPLTFVYELPYFKQLTTDTAAILLALQSSAKVVVDLPAGLVRPNFKLQRNTIILRDIPTEFTEKVRFCPCEIPFSSLRVTHLLILS